MKQIERVNRELKEAGIAVEGFGKGKEMVVSLEGKHGSPSAIKFIGSPRECLCFAMGFHAAFEKFTKNIVNNTPDFRKPL